MKSNSTRWILAAFCALVLSSCGRFKKNEVGIESKNFGDEIEMAQNLVFTFNKELAPEGKMGVWDSTKYIVFEPAVRGKFRWTDKNELVFSPQSQFAPSTLYKATLADELLREHKKYHFSKEDEVLEFHTPYLALKGFHSYWAKSEQSQQVQIRVQLNFNYDINPQDLKPLLKVFADEKSLPFTVESTGPGHNVMVSLDAENYGKDAVVLKVNLDKGLKINQGTYVTDKTFEYFQTLASRFELKIISAEPEVEENKGQIRIVSSQKILDENLSGTYKISPDVKTSIHLAENGVIIKGDFEIGSNYTLTLNNTLKGEIGGVLKEDFVKDIFFGTPPPAISFVNKKAIYLSERGEKNVGINIVGVDEVDLSIRKVYENNILAYMRSHRGYNYDYYDEDYGYYGTYSDDYDGHYSDIIVQKKIETKNLPKVNGISALNLNMSENKAYKGVYVVRVSSPDEYYLNAAKLVSISDIGLMVKQSGKDIMVFANSLKSAQPLKEIDITLVSRNNQSVYTLKTDKNGLAWFRDVPAKAPGFIIEMITARSADDFNYLMLEETRVETSRYDVSGRTGNSSGFEAFVYGDRNIYRPGETINFNTIVRNEKWESVGEVPLKIKLIMPNGKEYKVLRKTTNPQGAADGNIMLDAAVVTGTYSLDVYNGNDILMNSQQISVEEFMPDRIRVDVASNKNFYIPGDKAVITATAMNLFGPPAAGRSYEMELQLNRKSFYQKNYPNYSFDINSSSTFNSVNVNGTTDDKGIALQSFDISSAYRDLGVLEGKVYVTVFDETGRPVNRAKNFEVYTQNVFYGVAMDDYYTGTNQLMKIPLIALNKDGKAVMAEADVQIIRYEWQTVVEKYGSSYRYQSKKNEKIMLSRAVQIPVAGTTLNFSAPISGEYEVRIKRPGAENYVSSWFYAYGFGMTENSSFEVSSEGQVLITFDKEKYNTGDKAKVLFKTPFAGRLLVTVERNKVFDHFVINTDKKSAELELPVKEDYVPNVYVSATLIRPLDKSNLPLTVAHGFAPLMAEKAENRLPLQIMAVQQSRSKTSQTITVKSKAESNIEVTLAVVDEGILQVKNYKTPDPYGFFFQKRGLEVGSFDLYSYLFPELSLKSSSGGDGYNLEKRINPLSNTRVKLIAFWSGILKTNSNGEATYKIDIPQFSGQLRIMAVAYKNKSFGSAAASMTVADPIVISTALPRFFSPGDVIDMPVNISNTTARNANVTATVKVSGPLRLTGTDNFRIDIAGGKEGRITFPLSAQQYIGNGTVSVSVKGLGEEFTEKIDITVRPSTSLLKSSGAGSLKGGENTELTLTGDYIKSTQKGRLVLSKSPMVQFIKQFDYLLGYPHGCAEQTISKAFPQIYFADFVKTIDKGKPYLKSGENERNPSFNVQAAIRKIEGMQLYNGAVTMWPGSYDYENWWITAYAAHFLIEAKKAGYEVNAGSLDRIMEYLTYKTGVRVTTDYWYYEGNTLKSKKIAPYEMMYSLYILTLGNKPNRATMNYYKTNLSQITMDNRYLLAAAFGMIGDKLAAKFVLPSQYPADYSAKVTGGSFYSPLRNVSLVLNTLMETDPSNPQVGPLSRQLSEMLRNTRYYSTQELVFSFLALGKVVKSNSNANVTATVTAGGNKLGTFSGQDLILNKDLDQALSINTSGSGTLYYYWENEGISASGKYNEEDNYIRVRKAFFTRGGQQIKNNSFNQNDLVVVRITVSSLNAAQVDNVVLTDMLPAGFEIENPRLTEERDMPWITNRSNPDYFDVRDDRVNYYTSVGNYEKHFYYLVRAVSKGTYLMGPVSADAMYNGEIHSYNGAGKVLIK